MEAPRLPLTQRSQGSVPKGGLDHKPKIKSLSGSDFCSFSRLYQVARKVERLDIFKAFSAAWSEWRTNCNIAKQYSFSDDASNQHLIAEHQIRKIDRDHSSITFVERLDMYFSACAGIGIPRERIEHAFVRYARTHALKEDEIYEIAAACDRYRIGLDFRKLLEAYRSDPKAVENAKSEMWKIKLDICNKKEKGVRFTKERLNQIEDIKAKMRVLDKKRYKLITANKDASGVTRQLTPLFHTLNELVNIFDFHAKYEHLFESNTVNELEEINDLTTQYNELKLALGDDSLQNLFPRTDASNTLLFLRHPDTIVKDLKRAEQEKSIALFTAFIYELYRFPHVYDSLYTDRSSRALQTPDDIIATFIKSLQTDN